MSRYYNSIVVVAVIVGMVNLFDGHQAHPKVTHDMY